MDIQTYSAGKINVIKPSEDIRVRKVVNLRKVFDMFMTKPPFKVAVDLEKCNSSIPAASACW
jgi:hypothetical protein